MEGEGGYAVVEKHAIASASHPDSPGPERLLVHYRSGATLGRAHLSHIACEPGNAASITVKTAPNTACTITVTYKSGPSQAHGLDPKSGDKDGIVSWAWIVGTNTTPGEWPINVTCSAGSRQSTLETLFSVQ